MLSLLGPSIMVKQDCWPFFTQLPPSSPNDSGSYSSRQSPTKHCSSKSSNTNSKNCVTPHVTTSSPVTDSPPATIVSVESPSSPSCLIVTSPCVSSPPKQPHHNVFLHICDICCFSSHHLHALTLMGCDNYVSLLGGVTHSDPSQVKLTPVGNPHQGTPYALIWGPVSRCMVVTQSYFLSYRFHHGVRMTPEDWLHVTSDDMEDFILSGGVIRCESGDPVMVKQAPPHVAPTPTHDHLEA